MNEKLVRAIYYVVTRIAVVGFVVALVVSAYFSSMKTSNIYFVLNDALKARLDVILLKTDINEKENYFSYNYLSNAEYTSLSERYDLYKISNYSYKTEYGNIFVWPWQTRKTIRVKEAVYTINGEFDTTKMSKEDALAAGVYALPLWQASEYKVRLVYENGTWLIDDVEKIGDFDYQPPKTPSLTEAEIEALRTPSPAPTPTFDPSLNGVVDRSATITSALSGDLINLREGPATEYDVLEELELGTVVTVKEESDGWYRVVAPSGNEGYVSGYYITFN